jgi:hypothetical protein
MTPSSDGSAFSIFEETMGFELIDGTNLDAVLGMDILSQCDFTLLRDGTCRLSFAVGRFNLGSRPISEALKYVCQVLSRASRRPRAYRRGAGRG